MKTILHLFTFLILVGMGQAQTESGTVAQYLEPPEVAVRGFVGYKTEERAIIVSRAGTKVVSTGDRLGDYRVKSISAARGVTFSFQDLSTTVGWEHGAPPFEGSTWASRYTVRANNLELAYLLKAYAEVSRIDLYCSNEVYRAVSLVEASDPEAALKRLVAARGGLTYFKDRTKLIVGRPATVDKVKEVLAVVPPTHKQITLDFVNAQLSYVLNLLAGEINHKVQMQLVQDGGVTIQVKNGKAYNLILAAMALQGRPFQISGDSATLVIEQR